MYSYPNCANNNFSEDTGVEIACYFHTMGNNWIIVVQHGAYQPPFVLSFHWKIALDPKKIFTSLIQRWVESSKLL